MLCAALVFLSLSSVVSSRPSGSLVSPLPRVNILSLERSIAALSVLVDSTIAKIDARLANVTIDFESSVSRIMDAEQRTKEKVARAEIKMRALAVTLKLRALNVSDFWLRVVWVASGVLWVLAIAVFALQWCVDRDLRTARYRDRQGANPFAGTLKLRSRVSSV
jgi:hypothetical protein